MQSNLYIKFYLLMNLTNYYIIYFDRIESFSDVEICSRKNQWCCPHSIVLMNSEFVNIIEWVQHHWFFVLQIWVRQCYRMEATSLILSTELSKYCARLQTATARGLGWPAGRLAGRHTDAVLKHSFCYVCVVKISYFI